MPCNAAERPTMNAMPIEIERWTNGLGCKIVLAEAEQHQLHVLAPAVHVVTVITHGYVYVALGMHVVDDLREILLRQGLHRS
jgi:hypothetical protein